MDTPRMTPEHSNEQPEPVDDAFKFLNEDQTDEERLAFEEHLRSDPEYRRALIEALTTKAAVEMAYEEIGRRKRGVTCRSMRRLAGPYASGLLEPEQLATFSRHLDECQECRAHVRTLLARREHPPRVRGAIAAAAVVIGLGVAGAWAAGAFDGGPEHATGMNEGARELDALSLPLPDSRLEELEQWTLRMAPDSDDNKLDSGVRAVKRYRAEFFAELRAVPRVAQLMRAWGLTGKSPQEQERVLFLLAWYFDHRVQEDRRTRSLKQFAILVGDPTVAFLLSEAEKTSSETILRGALSALARTSLGGDENRRVRQLFDKAVDQSWDRAASVALSVLQSNKYSQLISLAIQVTDRAPGSLGHHTCELAASILVQAARKGEVEKAVVQRLARKGANPRARVHLVASLARTFKAPEWERAVRGLENHEDARVRRLLIDYLSAKRQRADLPVLQRIADSDPNPDNQALARLAIGRIRDQ